MKKRLIIIILIFIIFSGCSSKKIKEYDNTHSDMKRLNQFFSLCESDIKKAIKIIKKSDIIKNLSHLHRMDTGGKKYYLLERENISEMIQSVTEGIYSDLILINSNGTIIYTMKNDDIFGENVNNFIKDSFIYKCFIRSSKTDIYIQDITIYPPMTNNANLFFSIPDKKDGKTRGVFILQVNIKKLSMLIPGGTTIIGEDGKYRITVDSNDVLDSYPLFKKIKLTDMKNKKTNNFKYNGKSFDYYPYRYKNISWIVISENKNRS